MAGFLQAPPTTPLFERMRKENRLLMESTATSNFDPPNFRTVLPLPVLVEGFRKILVSLYAPSAFYSRAYRSLLHWKTRKPPKPPEIPLLPAIGVIARSIVQQGVLSSYRKAYWKFLLRLVARWSLNPAKFSLGFAILLFRTPFHTLCKKLSGPIEI
jgi:Domain of unknown function (DUF4070)